MQGFPLVLSPIVQVFWRAADIWTPTLFRYVDFSIKNCKEFSLSYDDKNCLEDIQYYIPENKNLYICYTANNKERVLFIKEDLEVLEKETGEK